jgi:hypothetical protein
MILAFKASIVVIIVMAVVGFLGYIIDKNQDRQEFPGRTL